MEPDVLQWIVILFVFSLAIGFIAPIGGVGGGALFVPIATVVFPFHVDFIRGAGLVIAVTSALSSAPYLIEMGLANIKIMLPIAVVSVIASIAGGRAGLWLTNAVPLGESYFSFFLGIVLLGIFVVMVTSRQIEFPQPKKVDPLSRRLGLHGSWHEPSLGKTVHYQTTNLVPGMLSFGGVGFIAGVFGIGAGWANVPVLNLLMGAPIKVSAAVSMAIITMNAAAASWVYIARGATLPLICIPSMIGISVGARLGAKAAARTKPLVVKHLVLAVVLIVGLLDIGKGMRGLGVL